MQMWRSTQAMEFQDLSAESSRFWSEKGWKEVMESLKLILSALDLLGFMHWQKWLC